jgi:RNA-directed DNA polymerase
MPSSRSLERAKRRIREITRRNRGISLEKMIEELNSYLTGWVTYSRHAACETHLQRLDEWIRRKLRCVRLKQPKRAKPIADLLQSLGAPKQSVWLLALSGKGYWRKSGSTQARQAMNKAWFKAQGLVSLSERYAALQP